VRSTGLKAGVNETGFIAKAEYASSTDFNNTGVRAGVIRHRIERNRFNGLQCKLIHGEAARD
jgi:hypothetical protein